MTGSGGARSAALVLLAAAALASPWWVSRLPATRTTPLPWRGVLARRFWSERAAGRLECRWRRPEYGRDLPYPVEWLRNRRFPAPGVPDTSMFLLGPADSAIPLRHRLPTHAIYVCQTRRELMGSVQPVVTLSIRDGWVASYFEHWSVPEAQGAAMFDSLHGTLVREYGSSTPCIDVPAWARTRRLEWKARAGALHVVLTHHRGPSDAEVPPARHDLVLHHTFRGSCTAPTS